MILYNQYNQVVGNEIYDWSSKERPTKSLIEGHYCKLELLDLERHATKLYDSLLIENDGSSWTYLPYGPFTSSSKFQDWLKQTMSEQDTVLFAILDNKTDCPIGVAGYLRINPDHGVIEIGHLHFSKLLQKTSAATEAMYLMMGYVFDTLKYRRCEWKCNTLNEGSKTAALRLGFQFEGIFRQSNVFKNHNRDTAWFSILDHEWPALNQEFTQWLNPNNFDARGKQIIPLNTNRTLT